MFQFYNITDEQRQELNIWADSVIESNKELMFSEKAYWLWSDRLYYQPGKDTWVDEAWWIEIAKKSFAKHKDNSYNGVGYPVQVVPSLEILVHHFPEEYRDYARNKLDRWYEQQGYNDPEYWFDLILAVYPDHPATELLFEEQYSIRETGVAIKLGDKNTINEIKEKIILDLEEGGVGWIIGYLGILSKSMFEDIFSQSESSMIKGKILKIAEQEQPVDSEDWLDQHLILKFSIILGWQEIIDALSKNVNYLERILYLVEEYDVTEEVLHWSSTDKFELTENLIFQLHPKISVLTEYHQLSFPSLCFKLAIAWKRSQSRA